MLIHELIKPQHKDTQNSNKNLLGKTHWIDFPIVLIYSISNNPIADLSCFKRCPYFYQFFNCLQDLFLSQAFQTNTPLDTLSYSCIILSRLILIKSSCIIFIFLSTSSNCTSFCFQFCQVCSDFKLLQSAIQSVNHDFSFNKVDECCSCFSAKMHKFPLNKHKIQSTSMLQIVHFDVWGTIPITSLFGYNY